MAYLCEVVISIEYLHSEIYDNYCSFAYMVITCIINHGSCIYPDLSTIALLPYAEQAASDCVHFVMKWIATFAVLTKWSMLVWQQLS